MNNYRIDYAHNTIVMDYKFYKAAQTMNSEEYDIVKNILADFPGMSVKVASHREQKTTHHNFRLTYDNMVQYMTTFENSADLLAEFARVKAHAVAAPQPYAVVRRWFVEKFPDYMTPVSRVVPKESFKSLERGYLNSPEAIA